jgi:hypothetical protein
LTLAIVMKRETDHPDANDCSFMSTTRRYTGPKEFVTRHIHVDCLRTVIASSTAKPREMVGADARVLILFGGHKVHLSETLNTWARRIRFHSPPCPHRLHISSSLLVKACASVSRPNTVCSARERDLQHLARLAKSEWESRGRLSLPLCRMPGSIQVFCRSSPKECSRVADWVRNL